MRKSREPNQFLRTLGQLPIKGSDGISATKNIQNWHERCRFRMEATYSHPRTGRPFQYGPLYENAASNALEAHLAALPNDEERVLFLLRFGEGSDRNRDSIVALLTNDRLFKLLDSGRELVEQAATWTAGRLDEASDWLETTPQAWRMPLWAILLIAGTIIALLILGMYL